MTTLRAIRIWTSAAVLTLSPWAQSQTGFSCRLGAGMMTNAVGAQYFDTAPTPDAQDHVYEALELYGCTPEDCGEPAVFRNVGLGDAARIDLEPGRWTIRYNPVWLNGIVQRIGPNAAFGVFAHEVGHYVDFVWTKEAWFHSSWDRELRADAIAGCIVARRGVPPHEFAALVRAIASAPSLSHPAWPDRLAAIQTGYSECGGAH